MFLWLYQSEVSFFRLVDVVRFEKFFLHTEFKLHAKTKLSVENLMLCTEGCFHRLECRNNNLSIGLSLIEKSLMMVFNKVFCMCVAVAVVFSPKPFNYIHSLFKSSCLFNRIHTQRWVARFWWISSWRQAKTSIMIGKKSAYQNMVLHMINNIIIFGALKICRQSEWTRCRPTE